MPLKRRGTLKNCRAASPFVRLVEGKEWWEANKHHQGVHLENFGGTESNHIVPYMVLKATVYGRHTTVPLLRRISRTPI
ncbi:hypothetical protein TNCV_4612571 [Trichonephila clavipes]|nr:hypothetical protein TNCV_4612571 [Trichonephila clavipes]